jgi:rare lipoprotein A
MKFRGYASFYSDKFHGQKTSSGEIYDKEKLTAAHPQLPFGTIVEVRNLSNNKTVRVKINDRGPFITGRIIDLSRAAAYALDMIKAGIIEVEITIISIP